MALNYLDQVPDAAAVDAPDGAGDVGGGLGGHEDDDVGDLLRRAEAPEGQLTEAHLVLHGLLRGHFVELAEGLGEAAGLGPELRPDRARGDRGHAYRGALGAGQ